MRIYGLDFTSAPSAKKPLTLAACMLDGDTLRVTDYETFAAFRPFEAFLRRPGPWVAGLDFAFGQPRKLVDNLGFPPDWQAYVELVERMGKREWVRTVDAYVQAREPGDKLHFRPVDRLAGAQSPMKMYFIPVGRMFYEGARRLAASDVSVVPNRPTTDNRVVLEVYPALVVRKLVGRSSKYKSDDTTQQTATAEAKRAAILNGIQQHSRDLYGLSLDLPPSLAGRFITDPTGDPLDALLAALQAAWGATQPNYGVPQGVDPLEGWIVDPDLLERHHG